MTGIAMTTLPLSVLRRGKVRDVYDVDADRLLVVATDRVSAFDVAGPALTTDIFLKVDANASSPVVVPVVAPVVTGTVAGFGRHGYRLALEAAVALLKEAG